MSKIVGFLLSKSLVLWWLFMVAACLLSALTATSSYLCVSPALLLKSSGALCWTESFTQRKSLHGGRDQVCYDESARSEVCREAQTVTHNLNLVRGYNGEGVEWGSCKSNQESVQATNLKTSTQVLIAGTQFFCILFHVF